MDEFLSIMHNFLVFFMSILYWSSDVQLSFEIIYYLLNTCLLIMIDLIITLLKSIRCMVWFSIRWRLFDVMHNNRMLHEVFWVCINLLWSNFNLKFVSKLISYFCWGLCFILLLILYYWYWIIFYNIKIIGLTSNLRILITLTRLVWTYVIKVQHWSQITLSYVLIIIIIYLQYTIKW